MFIAGHTAHTAISYCVMKKITCSLMIGQYFDTMIAASSVRVVKTSLQNLSAGNCFEPLNKDKTPPGLRSNMRDEPLEKKEENRPAFVTPTLICSIQLHACYLANEGEMWSSYVPQDRPAT